MSQHNIEENKIIEILRHSGLDVWRIDCTDGKCEAISGSDANKKYNSRIGYEKLRRRFLKSFVEEGYRDEILKMSDISYIRDVFEAGKASISFDINRADLDGVEQAWLKVVIVPESFDGDALTTAVMMIKDICRNVSRDISKAQLSKRFNVAIQNTYSAIMDLNYTRDTYRLTAYSVDFEYPYEEAGVCSELIEKATEITIHPDDREDFIRELSFKKTAQKLGKGNYNFAGEYRLLGDDGVYRWFSIRVVEIENSSPDMKLAIAFFRNIDEEKREFLKKENEAKRYNLALRESYENIFELNLSTGKIKIIQTIDDTADKNTNSYDYEGVYRYVVKNLLSGDDAVIRKKLSLQYLKCAFEVLEKKYVYFECKYYTPAIKQHWVSVRIVPVPGDDGAVRVMFLIRNIEETKREEEWAKQQRMQYDIALRESFDAIYKVNFETGIIDFIHTNLDPLKAQMNLIKYEDSIRYAAQVYIYPDDRREFAEKMCFENLRNQLYRNGEFYHEYRSLEPNGKYQWLSSTFRMIKTGFDGSRYAFCFVKNIDEKKNSEDIAVKYRMLNQQMEYQKQLSLSDSRYEIIVKQTGAAVFEWTRETGEVYASVGLPEHFRNNFIKTKTLSTSLPYEYIHKDDYKACGEFLKCLENKDVHTELTCRMKDAYDKYVWYKISATNIYNKNGVLERVVGTVVDVNTSKQMYEALKFRAEYDGLTGVPNIQKFCIDGKRLIESTDKKYAVLRMDIDKFKVVNDVYGSIEGDKILKYIADILRELCTEGSIFARSGDDVFVIMMQYEADGELVDLVEKISARIGEYPLEHKMKASFGICKVEDSSYPVSTLCDWAHLAAMKVKGSMMYNHAFYDDTLRNRILEEKTIEDEMRAALADGQFKLFLQPKYDIETSSVIGAEGLVRWHHPEKGIIPPSAFISLFERNGFIMELDEYIWEQTCIVIRSWIDRGWEPMPVSVNISRVHINNLNLCDTLINLVEKYSIPPRLLELEITESAFFSDMDGLYRALDVLQKFGFSIAMDDFGTGYSSLNMLKNVPVDIIKIDREFLNETVVTERGKTVIRYTIAMAKQLDMKVVAEGVETVDQAAFLLESGCNIAQGFYYSRPVSVEEFESLAFGQDEEKAIEPEINKVLSQNQDIVTIMLSLDTNANHAELFRSNTISENELGDLKRAFVSVINKYRLAMQKSNTSLLEVDFKTNTVLSTLRADSIAKDEKFMTFENIRDYILGHAKSKYIEELEMFFDVDYIVKRVVDNDLDIKVEFELVSGERSGWFVLNEIPIVKDRQLERLIFAVTDITTVKNRELSLENSLAESENMLDMTDDMFYIWNLADNSLRLSNKAKDFFDKREIKHSIIDTVSEARNLDDQTRAVLKNHIAGVLSGESKDDFEKVIETTAGAKFEIKSRKLFDADGNSVKIIGMIKEL